MASVEIVTPDGSQLVELRSSAVTFGRLASNDVALPYSHISRNHAEAQLRQGVWWLVDIGSTNGLHVNGQRVHETRLEPDLVIALSPQVSLRMLAAPEPPAPEPWSIAPPLADPAVTPLSAYGPRSPFADDEAPFYPNMRPPTPDSRPRPSSPSHPTQPAYSPTPSAPRPGSGFSPAISHPGITHPGAISHPGVTARSQFEQFDTGPRLDDTDGGASESRRRADELIRRRKATSGPAPAQSDEIIRRRSATAGPVGALLHLCQTCGQRTAPDAQFCQNCHHSIASECVHCRLSLLPVQDVCPRCQSSNPNSVFHGPRSAH